MNIIERIQCQFFKKLLNLPKCSPNYAVRIECNRVGLAVKILKLILNWIAKVNKMPESRYPKKCLVKLIDIAKDKKCVVKYNWISLINKFFLEPIEATDIWNNIDSLNDLEFRTSLINKYSVYLYDLDIKRYLNSSSLLFYPRIFPELMQIISFIKILVLSLKNLLCK